MKKIDLETLKNIALSKPLETATDNDTKFAKVSKFINIFKIKDGKNKVGVGLIYKVYANWSKIPMSKLSFCKEFSNLFISEKHNNRTFYLINYKPGMLVKKGSQLVDLRDNEEN